MNKIKILCLFLAVILVLPVMASCTGSKITSTVTLTFRVPTEEVDEDGNVKYDVKFTDKITVEGTSNNKPNVLQAVQLAFAEYEIDYELSKDGTYIASAFGLMEQERTDAEKGYFDFWECKINGQLSDAGRQSVTEIYENDEIVFTWTSDYKTRQDTAAVQTTDPNADTTGIVHSDDTTVPVDSAEEVA
ncbi:MAG: DUF4430 domain-containing protein [Clostridia bacterium]|nr:DUF4430 domain-containing protein [Clostridia bacterium]